MEEIRNEQDLPREKLHLAVRDSAANMVLAICIGEVDDVNCYLHLLNLVVTKGILDQQTVKDMVARASTVAQEFTHK
uniref:Uncharacterized protein n=1 Tax=Romanomermis culicivorax TaxID=13658 RepID=A0A915JWY7_ROMCU